MNSAEMIPMQSVIFMCISLGIMLLLPIVFMVVAVVRRKASFSSGFLGILGFVISFCTYGLIWCLFVALKSGGFVTTNLTMSYYMIYAVLVGVFSAAWMYFLRKKHSVKHTRPWEGMCIYAGFCFAGAIKLSLPLIDNIRLTLLYNKIGLDAIQKQFDSRSAKLVLEKLYQVSNKGSAYFLVDGLESVLLLILLLAMGYLLDFLLKQKKKSVRTVLFLLLIAFHTMTELPIQLLRTTSLEINGKEIILTVAACVAVGIDFLVTYKKKQGENV